jgi:glycine oxidase
LSASPDTIVIGAGVIGCSIAYELADAGARVRVIEARRVGGGASQASAGVLAPYIEGHEPGSFRALARRSLDLYDTFMSRVLAASGHAVQYDRSGTLEISLDEDDERRHRAASATLTGEGVEAQWLDASRLRDVEPLVASTARGGLFIPLHGFVGVPDLTEALAAAARSAGAIFTPIARVVRIQSASDGRVAVVTESETLVADRVILAGGSWSGHVAVAGADSVPVKPVRGQLLHLAWPFDPSTSSGSPRTTSRGDSPLLATAQPLRHVLWSTDCYIVPWQNGRVLVGATVEDAGFDERATVAGVRDLLEAACTLLPQLWQASFAEVRVGLRPASPDPLPIVGPSAAVPGLIYATGHFRNGVLLAPLTARLVKDLVLGPAEDEALTLLTPSRLGNL